jgi:hypothetical protein
MRNDYTADLLAWFAGPRWRRIDDISHKFSSKVHIINHLLPRYVAISLPILEGWKRR